MELTLEQKLLAQFQIMTEPLDFGRIKVDGHSQKNAVSQCCCRMRKNGLINADFIDGVLSVTGLTEEGKLKVPEVSLVV